VGREGLLTLWIGVYSQSAAGCFTRDVTVNYGVEVGDVTRTRDLGGAVMQRPRIAIGLCVASLSAAALVAAASAATSTKYTAALSGAQEVPANGSKATGTATITVTGKRLCYVITSKNLGAVPQMAHIHKGNKGN
jgi:hypothetical protein